MRKLKYILMFILSIALFNSCLVDDSSDLTLNDNGVNLAAFVLNTTNLSILADDQEHSVVFNVSMVGPTVSSLTNDITITIAADASSTAIVDDHYRIETPTLVLTKANNYRANVEVTIVTVGNKPLEEGQPGFEEWDSLYVAPVLVLEITSATGDENVINSGKTCAATINYATYCFFAGNYAVELIYRHPAYGTYPNNIYGGIRESEKTMSALTSKKCELLFAVWDEYCSLTIDPITYDILEFKRYAGTAITMGDPYDITKISHYDPITREIYLYYYYAGAPTGGDPYRIFWEVFTPLF